MWNLAAFILLTLSLTFGLRRILSRIFARLKQDMNQLSRKYAVLSKANEKIKEENKLLANQANETVLLYDITKEICKFLDLDKLFISFKEQVDKYVKVGDCKLLKGAVDLSAYAGSQVLELKIDQEQIGYLVLSQIKEQEKEKCHILAQQFLLGLKRAYLYQRIQELAITDSLTAVFARRYCLERLNEELERSKKFRYNFSFFMIDIDHFKEFNDQYGHLVGDAILREVSAAIKDNVRQIDLVGRYGGEEFLVILPETDQEQAKIAAERIRKAVASRRAKVYDENLKVTISIGIATFPRDSQEALPLIEKADAALYQAKESGRNRVCFHKTQES